MVNKKHPISVVTNRRPWPPPDPPFTHTGPVYRSFNEYVLNNPDGEHYRAWLTCIERPILFLPMNGDWNCLPGSYLWAVVVDFRDGTWGVRVSDNDDGSVIQSFTSEKKARETFEQLPDLAPFSMNELREFGYDVD